MVTKDPDSLPDSSDPGGPCPWCNRTAAFRHEGDMMLDYDTEGPFEAITPRLRVSALKCQGCDRGVAVIEERHTEFDDETEYELWSGIHWYPPPGASDLSLSIPTVARSAYAEAMKCMSVQAYRAAVVMLRRTLEAVVQDKGSTAALDERTLAGDLRIMGDEGILDRSLSAWANEIRLTGNIGAHVVESDALQSGEAKDLQHLTRRLLEYLYEMPERIRRSRGKE